MKRLLASLKPPKLYPAPEQRCRTYDLNEAIILHRNHEKQVAMSSATAPKPAKKRGQESHLPRQQGVSLATRVGRLFHSLQRQGTTQ